MSPVFSSAINSLMNTVAVGIFSILQIELYGDL